MILSLNRGAQAADEASHPDANKNKTIIGYTDGGEIRNIRVNDLGQLLIAATGTTVVGGNVGVWDGVNGPADIKTGTLNSLYVAVSDGGNLMDVKQNGAAQVALEILPTPEYDNGSINSSATATVTPGATSTVLIVCNICTGNMFYKIDGAAAGSDSGMVLFPNSCMVKDQGQFTTISLYNAHSGVCKYAVEWRR
jgi:hypothetical protein